MLLHKTEKVTHSVQCLLTNKYLDVISSAKASKSTKQICGVVGGRFYQQVDFSRSKQRHVWAGMCRTERGSGLYLAPAAASVSAENLSLLNRREHHSREMRPNPSIQARREGGKGWEQPMRGGEVGMSAWERTITYAAHFLQLANLSAAHSLSLTPLCSQISTHLFYTVFYIYHGPFYTIYFTFVTFLDSSSFSLVSLYIFWLIILYYIIILFIL